jgi:hypothetical protein
VSVTNPVETAKPRLFEEFFDPVDMIACFPADTPLAEVNRRAAEHGLRFPLFTDPARTLAEHFAVLDYAPASARFGAITDNVTGMNWQLPGGRRVRVGERVIKSATGYDLQRFLLHVDGRYGQATDYVLRLRPVGGEVTRGQFAGGAETLEKVRQELRRSSWNHWIDSVVLVIAEQTEPRLEVSVDCLDGESAIFREFFQSLAESAGAGFVPSAESPEPFLPAFSVKCVRRQVAEVASLCVERLGGSARGLVISGAVLVNPVREIDPELIRELRETVEPHGGHLLGLDQPELSDSEGGWAQTLEDLWSNL